MSLISVLPVLVAIAGLIALRTYSVLPRGRSASRTRREAGSTCSLAVFLGSGGHTSEMRALLSTLPYDRYTPRTYIYCEGDEMALKAVASLESSSGTLTTEVYTLLALPRARKVAEPLLSTLRSVLKAILITTWHIFFLPLIQHPLRPFADVLLINGPGTCVVLVLVCWIRRLLGLSYTRIIYVESFARVSSLSLSAKLVRPFVDRFVVQWPNAGAECRGWLV